MAWPEEARLKALGREAVHHVLIEEGFDPERVWRAIDDEGITYLGGVPTAYRRLLDVLEVRQADTSSRGRLIPASS